MAVYVATVDGAGYNCAEVEVEGAFLHGYRVAGDITPSWTWPATQVKEVSYSP